MELGQWWSTVRYTVATGGTPELPGRSPGMGRLRAAAILVVTLWAAFVGVLTVPAPQDTLIVELAVGVMVLLPGIIAIRSPLWAWRTVILLFAVTPALIHGYARSWGWPWSPGSALMAALVLLLVGASHRHGVLVCVAVVTVAESAFLVDDWRDLVLLGVLFAVMLLAGNALRQRRIAELERIEQQRGRLVEQTRAAVLEERARIARELHDVVAHHMSVLAVRADSARYRFPGIAPDVRDEFAGLTDTAREGMTELRRLLGVLRTEGEGAPTTPQPDAAGIADLVNRVRALGTECRLDVHGEFGDLPAGVALSLYRIVQEALSNAVRHAPGSAIEVDVRVAGERAELTVHNGPATASPGTEALGAGHGLVGMRERIAMLGGTLHATRTEVGGFLVTVTMPYAPTPSEGLPDKGKAEREQ